MGLGMTYWIVAWIMMAIAFMTAAGAILIGAMRLDSESRKRAERDASRDPAS